MGSLGRLHHAAQSVWTHNVRPARKTGCHALGLKAVKTPVTGCESCQALSALFPIAGARAANTAEKKTLATTKRRRSEFQIYIATNVATMASEAQKFWISWLVQNENQKNLLSGMRIGLHFWLFLLRKKSASIAFWYQNAACRENPDPNAACRRRVDG